MMACSAAFVSGIEIVWIMNVIIAVLGFGHDLLVLCFGVMLLCL